MGWNPIYRSGGPGRARSRPFDGSVAAFDSRLFSSLTEVVVLHLGATPGPPIFSDVMHTH
jgi:hypothetical protein